MLCNEIIAYFVVKVNAAKVSEDSCRLGYIVHAVLYSYVLFRLVVATMLTESRFSGIIYMQYIMLFECKGVKFQEYGAAE